jgi:hypothetical protein
MASDASGSWGCGAWHLGHLFQLQWDTDSAHLPIMVKELLPVVIQACAIWGLAWGTHCVIVHCDNQAVVACLRSRTSHDSHIMHMLRTLAFVEATYDFSLSPQYTSTGDNHLADDLSRDNRLSFLSKVSHADRQATPLPPQLVEVLLDPSTDWTSQCWLRLSNGIFETASPLPRVGLTDMAVDNPQATRMVRLHLKQSKSDQFGRGANVIVGRTELDICPVAAILAYVAIRGDEPGPFFLTTKKAPLSKQAFVEEIRKLLRALELPEDNYAGHSFHIGVATSAALAGIEDSTIQLLGRWQSGAFLRYIRTPHERLAAMSVALASQSRLTTDSRPTQ